jgi:hypothetical protein
MLWYRRYRPSGAPPPLATVFCEAGRVVSGPYYAVSVSAAAAAAAAVQADPRASFTLAEAGLPGACGDTDPEVRGQHSTEPAQHSMYLHTARTTAALARSPAHQCLPYFAHGVQCSPLATMNLAVNWIVWASTCNQGPPEVTAVVCPALPCPAHTQDPTCAKVTLLGRLRPVPAGAAQLAARAALFSRHPAMASWPAGHQFKM